MVLEKEKKERKREREAGMFIACESLVSDCIPASRDAPLDVT